MKSRLIIIRGNSGSGKSTVAKRLQRELGYGTMLIPQDVVRRELVRAKDGPNNPAIKLIAQNVLYAKEIGYDVILEGILANKHYREMLDGLIDAFDDNVFAYYFDIPFEETLRRHNTKSNSSDYGEKELRVWWNEKDVLGIESEKVIGADLSEQQIVDLIVGEIGAIA